MTAAIVREGLGARACELRAPRGARVLAGAAFGWCVLGVLAQIPGVWRDEGLRLVLASFFAAVSAVGLGTRLARLRVDGDGVHWGRGGFGFRFSRARIRLARVFRDGALLVPEIGRFAWFIAVRDYQPFAVFSPALRKVGVPLVEEPGKAPFSARVQSYGRALDGLLGVCVLGTTALYLLA